MTNLQIYIGCLKQMWWFFALVIIVIAMTAYSERGQASEVRK